jgi:hypothetical protein
MVKGSGYRIYIAGGGRGYTTMGCYTSKRPLQYFNPQRQGQATRNEAAPLTVDTTANQKLRPQLRTLHASTIDE